MLQRAGKLGQNLGPDCSSPSDLAFNQECLKIWIKKTEANDTVPLTDVSGVLEFFMDYAPLAQIKKKTKFIFLIYKEIQFRWDWSK